MLPSTPVARSKSAALARVLDVAPRGYTRYTAGTIAAKKLPALARKLHERHEIAATRSRRMVKKKHGQANAMLVLYAPQGAELVHWLMLFTAGELSSPEQLKDATDKARLYWLDYELVQLPGRGATATWSWRRPKDAMRDLYAEIDRNQGKQAMAELLARIARQPGFRGVREQSWSLCEYARRQGYAGELPHLYFLQKLPHGDPLYIS